MSLREGAFASWIGDDPDLEIGERCRVVSQDRTHSHVKWVTGSKTGQFELVANDDLVADREPARDLDAFTFETHTGHLVQVACLEVLDRGGEKALWTALQREGHFRPVAETATAQVNELVARLRSDPSWVEVQSTIGDDPRFERHALRQLLLAALETVDSHAATAEASGA